MSAQTQTIMLPMDEFVRQVAREAAEDVMKQVLTDHVGSCPARANYIENRQNLRRMEMRYWAFVGLVVGSGACGGLFGVVAAQVAQIVGQ